MSEKYDGGDAFPCGSGGDMYFGMTLRDYFAAKAVQGLFSTMTDPAGLQRAMKLGGFTNPHDWIASTAYAVADAMLAERNKP